MPKSVNPLGRQRPKPSPLETVKRSKIKSSGKRKEQEAAEERLDDTGIIPSLAPRGVSQDVNNLVRYIHARMWADIPETAAGMGSERISEILRYRQALPRIVSVAHVHALSSSATQTERELARFIASGGIRKVVVPGRGKGGAAVGEGIVLAEDWKNGVREEQGLSEELKERYLSLLDSNPGTGMAPTSSLSKDQVRQLVQTGYLISPSALSSNLSNAFARPGAANLGTLSQSGFKSATGSLDAVGGSGAIQESGGGGSTLATRDNRPSSDKSSKQHTMTFSLPSTGPYLKLLTTARLHLLALLKQLSPRHKEATLSLLKEKWDGNIPNDETSRAKRARGEWTGVLPGKTKKWKDFNGLEFEWVLEECVGSGLLELFDTGSVGLAVRGT